jgi:F-type H+-transporting ATPase subunit delta
MATAVARRYARALFELAEESGELEAWPKRLEALRRLFADPAVRAIVASPVVPPAQRLAAMDSVGPASLGPEAYNLARLLVETSATGIIDDLANEFEGLVDAAEGRVRGVATTAIPLEEPQRQQLARDLSRRLGQDVRLEYQVDKNILGGLVLRLGDRLIDASLRSRLQQLRLHLLGT